MIFIQIRLSRSEGYLPAILDANESAVSLPLCELSLEKSLETETTVLSSNNEASIMKNTRISSPPTKFWSPANDQRDNPVQKEQSSNFMKKLML